MEACGKGPGTKVLEPTNGRLGKLTRQGPVPCSKADGSFDLGIEQGEGYALAFGPLGLSMNEP